MVGIEYAWSDYFTGKTAKDCLGKADGELGQQGIFIGQVLESQLGFDHGLPDEHAIAMLSHPE
jgi:hypothetical protein